jgi:hypothetical protein
LSLYGYYLPWVLPADLEISIYSLDCIHYWLVFLLSRHKILQNTTDGKLVTGDYRDRLLTLSFIDTDRHDQWKFNTTAETSKLALLFRSTNLVQLSCIRIQKLLAT